MTTSATTAKRRANGGRRRNAGVNIEHVANLAGVSRATAARVFSDAHLVADSTQQAVHEAATMLNYTPNLLARALAGGRTNMIGILWGLGGTSAAIETTHLLATALEQHRYMPYVTDFRVETPSAGPMLDELCRRSFDAVVIQATGDGRAIRENSKILDQLASFRAVVLIGNQPMGLPFDEVVRDRLGAYREAARHFAAAGRRRPAIMLANQYGNITKVEAFFNEARRCGMEVLPDAVIDTTSGDSMNAGYVRQVLESRFSGGESPFDAIMCGNDELAMLTGAWLSEQGLRVPNDIALAGFDDLRVSAFLNPPLASADRRGQEVADTVAELLTSRLEQSDLPIRSHKLPMRFLWRESAGGLPAMGKETIEK